MLKRKLVKKLLQNFKIVLYLLFEIKFSVLGKFLRNRFVGFGY